ncbi:hypothetical protein K1719_046883 [Acacia pycnantha]|nr:hypothetical protein K1719_046883 [Acacia pycnantha]
MKTSPDPAISSSISTFDKRSVLTDITNNPSNYSSIQSKANAIMEDISIVATPSAHVNSHNISQKSRTRRTTKIVNQVATDLLKRINEFIDERDTHVQYHEGDLHGDIDTNLPQTFASSYLDEGDANYECQFCGANMWFSERLKRSAAEIIKHDVVHDVNIRLIRNGNSSGLDKKYNVPTTSELAALIVGDFDNSYTNRDIIVKRQCGALQRIAELHMAYLPLQYPLFFHYGHNGYDSSIEHAQESLSKT